MKLDRLTKPVSDFWESLENRLLPSYVWDSDPFTFWKERILFMICSVSVVFGLIALIPSVWLSFQEGLINVAILDILSYGAVAAVLIFRDLPLRFRFGVIFAVLYVLGTGLLFVLGPVGAGYIWLLGASILISTVYDIKAASYTLVLNALIFLSIAGCIHADVLEWPLLMENPLEKWLVMTVNFLLINAFVNITTAMMLRNLKYHFQKEQGMRIRLEESEARLHAVFDSVGSIPVQGYDRDRRVIFWNRASEQLYGYSRDEALGQQLEDLIIPDEMRQGIIGAVSEWVQNGVRIPACELILRNKNNDPVFVYSDHVMITNINGEKEMFCVDLDLSDFKRIENEKSRVEEKYRQAQKMEAIGRLAGGVAHDFNNMLGIIKGYSEITLKKMATTDPLRSYIEEIYEAGARSERIVRQLLGFARRQTVQPIPLNLNQAVKNMLSILRKLIGENITLTFSSTDDMLQVYIDPSQIDQILANLCINARDAISDVGEIRIKTTKTTLGETNGNDFEIKAPGEYVVLTLQDNGGGMNQETLSYIFEPFYTTKKLGHGTGLGLSTVYGIVKQNEGFTEVTSAPGKGTSFKIYLPLYTGDVTEKPEIPAREIPDGGGETVLVVEDDPAMLRMIKDTLGILGYSVLAADSPGKALELAKTHKNEISLLMADVVMPEMNGRNLAKQVGAIIPGLRCLFTSGYSAEIISHQGVLENDLNFIPKPFTMETLANQIKTIME